MESGCSSRLNLMRMVVKMATFPSITVLLLCCSSVASTDSQCHLYAETNKDITVPLGITVANSMMLAWKKDETVIFRRRSGRVSKGAVGDVTQDGSLILKKVSKDKAGTYTPEVYTADGKAVGGMKSTKLCVIDPAPIPTLKIECGKKEILVTCNVPQQTEGLNIAWVQNGKVLEAETKKTLKRDIAKVLEKATFSCNVSNKVSSRASEPKTQTCIKPGFSFPKEIFGISTWYFVGGGGGVVLLLIILVIVCCIRMRRKKTMQVKDEEELRLGWTNQNQQHHHHQHGPAPNQHHHHHHQQPAGHTGPRQHRSKQPRSQQRPSRDPAHPNGQPQPSPRRAAQVPRPADTTDDEKPPPLPQPRKKAPKTARV
ncbi:T-cell surface antigen CD2 isoform X1 [Sparus aurata]|uniref:T-cell surface antigen CD2 isoform X1 n=1 Tax=Sparus aurata TaxID=8175 RepID=UPI0011C13C6F|nr:T-cell surface antigen CD2-like isoform X1 [Sparus aurata]